MLAICLQMNALAFTLLIDTFDGAWYLNGRNYKNAAEATRFKPLSWLSFRSLDNFFSPRGFSSLSCTWLYTLVEICEQVIVVQ